MNKNFKNKAWLGFMLSGIGLLAWAIANGESFAWHIPLACGLLITGILIEAGKDYDE
jgi:hypothetical protein